jgi:hypothetical protein
MAAHQCLLIHILFFGVSFKTSTKRFAPLIIHYFSVYFSYIYLYFFLNETEQSFLIKLTTKYITQYQQMPIKQIKQKRVE